ncbi:hypothetical protein GW932_01050 [archaeon]|nr:hypothetical protein [archaeon]
MAGTNTEKPTSKAEKKKTAPVVKETKQAVEKAPVKTETKKETKAEKKKVEIKKVKRNEVKAVNLGMPVSTKTAVSICKFIKNKKIQKAIDDLIEVTKLKKAVPMKGEIPHRKGKIMAGRFPERAAKEFIVLIRNLQGNANQHDLEEAVICEAIANKGTTTYAKGGRARKKRTHIVIVAKEKKLIKQEKKKQ